MYAYTSNSYRAVSGVEDLLPGEQISEDVPAIVLAAIKGTQVRSIRSGLLRSSDWTQVSDNNLTAQERSAWAVYRQALREVPQQAGFPEVDWPVAPTQRSEAGNETGETS